MPYMAGLRRFLDEAQILSKLEQIPSVVDITDTFRENNTAYFVMEYLDGADLRQIVRASQGRLPVKQVTDIILQVAVSMDVIHTKTRIIHRDISPENIYITRNGRVKVIDFGSAKQTETGMRAGLSVVLKPKFAPPEQFSSQMEQGSFTDVYSLAGTYYYVLTGTNIPSAPDRLAGKSYVALKYMNLGVPEGISDAVDRALNLSVSQRTRTMQQFIAEIAAATQPVPRPQPMPQPTPRPQPVPQPTPRPQPVPGPQPVPRPQPVPAPKPKQVAVPYVAVVQGTERGKQWDIPAGQSLKVGRSDAEANLQIHKPDCLSRVHCIVTYLPDCGRFCIRDVSANGVYYRGKRLKKGTDYNVKPPARFILASQDCVIELGVRHEYR